MNQHNPEAAAKSLYCGIMRDLYKEGEAIRTFHGSQYMFLFTGFSTEITRNGAFFCEVLHGWELEELLNDVFTEQF